MIIKDTSTILTYYQKNKERARARYIKNREQLLAKDQRWRNSTKEQRAIWRQNNKEKIKNCQQSWYFKNKDLLLTKQRERNQKLRANKDPLFKITISLRSRLHKALKNKGYKKCKHTMELLGCSIEEARKHIEAQWLPGMSWYNHTLKGWHIDHIKPINTFDLTDPEQQKQCFHYSNLRPLWAADNLSRPRNGSDLKNI